VRLILGDCRAKMKELDAASVDALVTDPPAGISFMGRSWDHDHGGRDKWIAAFAAIFRECYRVLKPGAHGLVWALPRTSHWTATALEDAGFEVRDVVLHLFGSGFPKSLDVSKSIDRGYRREDANAEYVWRPFSGPSADVYAVTGFIRAGRDRLGVKNHQIDDLFGFNGMAGHWTSSTSQPAVPSWPQWEKLKVLLGLDDSMDATVETLNGGKGDRSIENTALAERDVLGTHDVAAPGQIWNANYGNRANLEPGKILGDAATAAGAKWEGWGTALKPAAEYWILVRRPLISTVAANVLAHGTGAINVDGCRIGSTVETWPASRSYGGDADNRSWATGSPGKKETQATGDVPPGRWPANVVLSHTPECREVGTKKIKGAGAGTVCSRRDAEGRCLGHENAGRSTSGATVPPPLGRRPGGLMPGAERGDPRPNAEVYGTETVAAWECAEGCPVRMLDEQSGEGTSIVRVSEDRDEPGATFSLGRTGTTPRGHADSGGASRFFYTAKASRWDREVGLEGMPEKARPTMGSGIGGQPDQQRPNNRNVHPTVKPTDLMRWLCRLVTQPGGAVLDPFMGSGSTGVAALAEGFEFVGIEQDPEYLEIARRRIGNVAPLFAGVPEEPEPLEDEGDAPAPEPEAPQGEPDAPPDSPGGRWGPGPDERPEPPDPRQRDLFEEEP
jgi:DNA modification methylase